MGAPGVDNVYGWGLVDAQKAMLPLGTLGVASVGSSQINQAAVTPISGSKLVLPGNVKINSVPGLRKVAAVDGYNRAFSLDMSGAVINRNSSSLSGTHSFDDYTMIPLWNEQGKHLIIGEKEVLPGKWAAAMVAGDQKNEIKIAYDPTSFGMVTGGALETRSKGSYFIEGSHELMAVDGVGLFASGGYGYAPGQTGKALITQVSAMKAYSWKGGVSTQINGWNTGVWAGIPMTVYEGGLQLNTPVSQNGDGSLNYSASTLSLNQKPVPMIGLSAYNRRGTKAELKANREEVMLSGGWDW